MNNCLIIPAGGTGQRFGSTLPKQFHLLDGIPLIIRTLKAFENIASINSIVISAHKDYIDELNSIIGTSQISKQTTIIEGGATRQDSVYNALITDAAQSSELVLIHDAVRPFVNMETVNKLIAVAKETGGAVPALKPKETVRKIIAGGKYITLEREKIRIIQTPQVFKTRLITQAFEKALRDKFYSTDDAAVFELYGYDYLIVDGDEENIKITTQKDFALAEILLELNKDK